MAKNDKTEIDIGCVYDFIPMIQDRLGDRCPSEDVLLEVLEVYTDMLLRTVNEAMRFRYMDSARKYDPSLPTSQECFDKVKTEWGIDGIKIRQKMGNS